ncbi:hypothetical protein FHS81_001862 [Pseudochelatococcus contaminans]|uniref:Uncharacterized protein n=1 Tax=Pseudochelatococcus contaminans TaxID=1538103 RepID=A0A7W5Z4D7_9HYPH|nr:hypothetical protein [Pseudochelatococcus contaminans]
MVWTGQILKNSFVSRARKKPERIPPHSYAEGRILVAQLAIEACGNDAQAVPAPDRMR